jgi:hypothetical protein
MEVISQLHDAWERSPGTHWTAGCVDTRTDLRCVEGRNIPCPCRESNPDLSVVQPRSLVHTPTEISHFHMLHKVNFNIRLLKREK